MKSQQERGRWEGFGLRGAKLVSVFISELWFWFCRNYCKEEEKLFYDSIEKIVFLSLFSLTHTFFLSLSSGFVFLSQLYAKTNLSSAETSFTFFLFFLFFLTCTSFHFIWKVLFLLLFNFPVSPPPLFFFKPCSSLLCTSLKRFHQSSYVTTLVAPSHHAPVVR